MSSPTPRKSIQDAWVETDKQLRRLFPHLAAWYNSTDEFDRLTIMLRDDGTHLAIGKGYGDDGGPIVCFGGGYGLAAALMSIDKTIQAGNWKVDKPYSARKGSGGGETK